MSKTSSQPKSSSKQKSILDYYESKIALIDISKIKIGKRVRRQLDQNQIQHLAESISEIGLLNPITITKKKDLVAGYHRLHACKELGWEKIPCVITTVQNPLLLELQEIDENLIRYELHFIDRGIHLKRRKEIYESLHPESKRIEKIKKNLKQFSDNETVSPSVKSFTEDTAIKTGVSKRTIEQEIQIIENVDEEIQNFIKEKEISKRDALKLARMPIEDQKKIKEAIEEGNPKNTFIDNIYAKVKKQKKPKTIPKLPKDKYNVIYADPPWYYEGGTTPNRIIENQYPTMKTEEICKLEIPAAKDAILFLWVTSPKLEEGLNVLKSWDFVYKTSMVWVKDKIGMGYYARGRHEFLLIGTKGSPGVPEPKVRPDSVIEAPRITHSKKPMGVYDLIEQMYPKGKYIELFARNTRKNWKSWGNEV